METISEFWSSFEQAWNSHNAHAVAQHFEEDGILHFFDGQEFVGPKAITRFYSETFSEMPPTWFHYTSSNEEHALGASGTIQIKDAAKLTVIIETQYALELSPKFYIRKLKLRRDNA